jgi:S1-C subfamily serine protease
MSMTRLIGSWAHRPQLGLLLSSAVLSGCGNPDAEYPVTPPLAVQAEVQEEHRPPGTVWRDEVLETVDAGLGAFLQKVDVEPHIEQGRFLGFRIVELRPPQYWHGVDLQPGDVVTRVNQAPIERETEAHKTFEGLRTASHIEVAYQRAGEPRTITFTIVERPGQRAARERAEAKDKPPQAASPAQKPATPPPSGAPTPPAPKKAPSDKP